MTNNLLSQQIDQANEAAGNGNWDSALEILLKAQEENPEEIGIINAVGTCLLNLNRASEAIPHFQKVIANSPENSDAYLNPGIAYAMLGDTKSAEEMYRKALELNPDHIMASKSLAALYLNHPDHIAEGLEILINLLRKNPQDIETILTLADQYFQGEDFYSAKQMAEYASTLEPENAIATEILRKTAEKSVKLETDQILRPDQVKKLAQLKNLKKDAGTPALENKAPAFAEEPPRFTFLNKYRSVCVYCGEEFANGVRLLTPVKALERSGVKVKFSAEVNQSDFYQYDTFVFSRPHLKQEWIDAFLNCNENGKRAIIDIDEDFHKLPNTHPGFEVLGLGNPNALKIFERILERADFVTTSSALLADHYRSFSKNVLFLPSGWDNENPLWSSPAPSHDTFNVGWIDYATEVENLQIVKHDVAEFLKQTPEALLVLGGVLESVNVFNNVPQEKVLFIPFAGYDEYPFTLAHFDLLISPVRKSPYNMSKPDTRIVEAGARNIPWIASRIPSYEAWGKGGVFVDRNGETWFEALKRLAGNQELRNNLAAEGKAKADNRKSDSIAKLWLDLLS
jgi:tetratricopeptide (TPR) repeat protein